MAIDVNFFENLSDDLKRIVSDASKAIMDVYERNTFDKIGRASCRERV